MEGERLVGGLRCGEVLERLDAFVDGTLDEAARTRVIAHVSGCDRCARFGRTYGEVVRRTRGVARPPEPELDVLERLRARVMGLDLDPE